MDPELVALIQQILGQADGGTDVKSQKAMMDMLAKRLNFGQDVNSSIFDPKMGMLTDTYDPMLVAQGMPQAPSPYVDSVPFTEQQMADGGVMGDIAAGMIAGRLSLTQAQKMILESSKDPNSDLYGMEPTQLFDTVSMMSKEVADNQSSRSRYEQQAATSASQAKRTDPYAMAGLPSPLEQYDETNAPTDPRSAERLRMLQSKAQNSAYDLAQMKAPSTPMNAQQSREALLGPGTPMTAQQRADVASIQGSVPKSVDEARVLAKRMGLPEDQVVGWYKSVTNRLGSGMLPGVSSDEDLFAKQWRALLTGISKGQGIGDIGNKPESASNGLFINPNASPEAQKKWDSDNAAYKSKAQQAALTWLSGASARGTDPSLPAFTMTADRADREQRAKAPKTPVDRSYEDAKLKASRDKRDAVGYAAAEREAAVRAAAYAGRSPLSDAIAKRTMLMKALGITS
jgi:hypothetical protein